MIAPKPVTKPKIFELEGLNEQLKINVLETKTVANNNPIIFFSPFIFNIIQIGKSKCSLDLSLVLIVDKSMSFLNIEP